MVLHNGPIIRAKVTGIPLAGTDAADQRRDDFIAKLLEITGRDSRLLWLPSTGDTTTTTSEDRNARVFTYDATIATRISNLGSGVEVDFDGTNDEADVPDAANLSFGDGTYDDPFSIIALVKIDDASPTAANTILSKWNKDTDAQLREWRFFLTASNGYPTLEVYDESANAYIGRQDQTAITADTWTLIVATYSGSTTSAGVSIYVNGASLDDANSASGSYTAMENTTAIVSLAHTLSAASSPAAEEFWVGNMALVNLVSGELSIDQIWAVKALCNGRYDLAL